MDDIHAEARAGINFAAQKVSVDARVTRAIAPGVAQEPCVGLRIVGAQLALLELQHGNAPGATTNIPDPVSGPAGAMVGRHAGGLTGAGLDLCAVGGRARRDARPVAGGAGSGLAGDHQGRETLFLNGGPNGRMFYYGMALAPLAKESRAQVLRIKASVQTAIEAGAALCDTVAEFLEQAAATVRR